MGAAGRGRGPAAPLWVACCMATPCAGIDMRWMPWLPVSNEELAALSLCVYEEPAPLSAYEEEEGSLRAASVYGYALGSQASFTAANLEVHHVKNFLRVAREESSPPGTCAWMCSGELPAQGLRPGRPRHRAVGPELQGRLRRGPRERDAAPGGADRVPPRSHQVSRQ
ncbi:unnamed protein product [Prorocentrum cordatum]|uniref:Subtilisin n=1 Tax=Prorocentrum cordatum TaxID=2364126 RepID=A0ABN9TZW8_9DINO|nr:unnamed protein product [Polarella glacialis]